MTEINERIRKIRSVYCNDNNRQFAESLGKSTSYVSDMCNGGAVGKQSIEKILTTFPQVSRAWLVLGEGQMIEDSTKKPADSNKPELQPMKVIETTPAPQPIVSTMQDLNSKLEQMYEARLADKDELIAQLKKRCEIQEQYIAILSDEHRSLIHKIVNTTEDNHNILRELRNSIGFKFNKGE